MGMFDSVYFNCPNCDNTIEEQSKAGECILMNYGQSEVPVNIANDIIGTAVYCDKCNKSFKIVSNVKEIPLTVPLRLTKNLL